MLVKPGRLTQNTKASNHQTDKKDQCGICLDMAFSSKKVAQFACEHKFHPECSSAWMEVNPTCPLCKAEVLKLPEPEKQETVEEKVVDCAVCQEIIDPKTKEEEDKEKTLKCKHSFHAKCIDTWFNTETQKTRKTCPTCRNVESETTSRRVNLQPERNRRSGENFLILNRNRFRVTEGPALQVNSVALGVFRDRAPLSGVGRGAGGTASLVNSVALGVFRNGSAFLGLGRGQRPLNDQPISLWSGRVGR